MVPALNKITKPMFSLFRKIRNKFRSTVLPVLIKVSVLVDAPGLTAWLIAANAQRLNQTGRYTVLCLRRSVFIDDIWAMIKYSGKIKYLSIERKYLTIILASFLKAQEQKDLTENNYHTLPIGQSGKKRYYEYLRRMLPVLRRKLNFQAIASGNFGYVQQQELMRLCKERGIPFVVFHKEGLIAGFFEGADDIYYGRKFLGDRLLVYNKKILGALLGKVSDLTRERIRLVGVPRLDHYHHSIPPSLRPQIILFSFFIKQWLPKIFPNKNLHSLAEQRAQLFHEWVINFATRHPEVDVVIKTKAAGFYLDYAREIFSSLPRKLPNLFLDNLGDPIKLIQKSRVVLGFNSMALIEALLDRKPIFSPFFGDLVDEGNPWDYFFGYPKLVNYAKSQQDLEQQLLQSLRSPEQVPVPTEFIEQFVYQPDGKASERAERVIINLIEEFSNANS